MAVMDIAHMRMGMSGGCMGVFMGMPVGVMSGLPIEIFWRVLVLVMEIASPWVVAMAVGMAQCLMVMPVAVLLPKQENNASTHQSGCHNQVECEGIAQDRHRKDGANKGSCREDHRFSRCT